MRSVVARWTVFAVLLNVSGMPFADDAPPTAATPSAVDTSSPTTPATTTVHVPMGNVSDIDSTVMDSLKSSMDCKANAESGDRATVCGWINDFESGQRPKAPPPGGLFFGRSYKVDDNGRLIDAAYEALVPSATEVARLGRASLKPDNALDELDLQALLSASRAHQALPQNATLDRIRHDAAAAGGIAAATSGPSVLIGPDAAGNRTYLRQNKDVILLLTVTGNTPEDQARNTIVVGGLN